MVSKTIIFNYRYGIDIYFATEVMRKAREFESKIVIEYDGKKIKNKSPLMLSGFGIKMGSEITIYADGADEKEALETVSNLLGIIAEEDICKQEMANVDEQEELEKENIIFIAGGVGAAPVYPQVKWLRERGIEADVILGARNKDLLIMEEDLRKVAKNVYVTTDDGSYGDKGVVTDVLKRLVNEEGKKYTRCIAIGPVIMMKFAALTTKELGIPTIVSMNPIMIDGTGMCGACRLVVGDQVKFACVDGPEFDGHLVDFNLAMKRQQTYKTEEGKALLELLEAEKSHGGCGNCN